MRYRTQFIVTAMAVLCAAPSIARAQYNAPSMSNQAIGEKYHIELAGTFWNPDLTGIVASEQFGQIGSDLDFNADLGFKKTRFRDLRLVLRPAKKHKFRFQYTPIDYIADSTLSREVVFNGQKFPVSLPISSEFGWKVARFGYEYDMVYRNRGFIGIILEGRYTEMIASLASRNPFLAVSEFSTAKAPLPAAGIVGRGYIARNVSIDFEMTGFQLPDVDPKYQANYFDWDVHGTFNLGHNGGLQVGWRRMTTFLRVENDSADFKFQGMYFGGVVRY